MASVLTSTFTSTTHKPSLSLRLTYACSHLISFAVAIGYTQLKMTTKMEYVNLGKSGLKVSVNHDGILLPYHGQESPTDQGNRFPSSFSDACRTGPQHRG